MDSRTPAAFLNQDDELKQTATVRAPAIPELERSPFPPTAEPDRMGAVVSSGPRANRPILKRRVSPSSVLLVLFGAAIAIVLYISNVIAVGNLLAEINALENRHRKMVMEQERLQFEIRQLASLERIQSRAESELGLAAVRVAPNWMSIDRDKIRDIEEALAERKP